MADLSAVGIDLGTAYSAVAVVDEHGSPTILPNAESERLTPSAVFFDDESIVVGQIAKDAAATTPDHVVMFVKRQMGNPNWYFPHHQQRYSPTDISAMVLRKLKQDAESYLGRLLPYAVITVPAYFEEANRRATIAAGEIAGFRVLDLINEPTAAAIAFGAHRSEQNETVLIYDLGGGTFDVTIMRIEGQDFRVLASDGAHQLGGKDFDDAIMRFAVEHFKGEHNFDPAEDATEAGDLRSTAEKAKRELSKRLKTQLMVRSQGRTSRIEISREQFDSLIKPKIDTTLTLVRSTLRDAKLSIEHIDRVLLIGGSTRVIGVRMALAQFFGKEPDSSVNPDEAVALGAAIMAAKKASEIMPEEVAPPIVEKVGGLQITDVTSHSLGIEAFVPGTSQRINSIIIPRNSPIPTEVSREFVTTLPGQTAIKVTIFQGEFPDPALCNPVGDFTLGGLPPNRQPGRKIRVTVSCAASGVVNVTALDLETGTQTITAVSYKVGQSAEQISARGRWLNTKSVV